MQKEEGEGSSLGVHWLRLHASEAGGAGSVPGWGTEIDHITQNGFTFIQNQNKNDMTTPYCDPREIAEHLPSRHNVCMPFCLFFLTLSKKLSGLQVSVQKTIDTVSPNLYN